MSLSVCHTFRGTFDPFAPRPEDVRLEDIAHHLAMICRYGGACPVFYSVAEHAVRVARLVESLNPRNPEGALLALHHDSAEAYIHDIRRPIKSSLIVSPDPATYKPRLFSEVEGLVLLAIAAGLELPEPGGDDELLIDAADNALLAAELRAFWPNDTSEADRIQARTPLSEPKIELGACLPWEAARDEFLATHHRLVAACSAGVS